MIDTDFTNNHSTQENHLVHRTDHHHGLESGADYLHSTSIFSVVGIQRAFNKWFTSVDNPTSSLDQAPAGYDENQPIGDIEFESDSKLMGVFSSVFKLLDPETPRNHHDGELFTREAATSFS